MFKKLRISALTLLLTFSLAIGGVYSLLPDSVSVAGGGDLATAVTGRIDLPAVTATVSGDSATIKVLGVPVKNIPLNVLDTSDIYVGGMPFGVKFFTKGVLVVGLTDVVGFGTPVCPAREAGIEKGDVVTAVNGTEPASATEFRDTVANCGGKGLELVVTRGDSVFTTTVYPVLCAEDNCYRAGLWVRDSTAGIGTVTYIKGSDGSFGGLGHGICDSETGTLMPLGRAVTVDVEITGVRKGQPNAPGELKGSFGKIQRGVIEKNTETGVYGKLSGLPQSLGTPVSVGYKEQLKEGKAYVYTTVSGVAPQRYEIEIEKIYKDSKNTKNFLIRVTDSKLLEKTGGIVQGMSGSPIIQNGCLVGAVTHVLVNDSTRGYGIYIENMLK